MTAPNTPKPIKPAKPDKSSASTRQSLAGVRLRRHSDYQRAYAASRKRQSASMSWFLAPRAVPTEDFGRVNARPSGAKARADVAEVDARAEARTVQTPRFSSAWTGRVGLTAGKVLGKAHERNRIKRRMREALRRHIDLLPPRADLILHPRRVVLTMEFTKLEEEVVRILTQAGADAAKFASGPPVRMPA